MRLLPNHEESNRAPPHPQLLVNARFLLVVDLTGKLTA